MVDRAGNVVVAESCSHAVPTVSKEGDRLVSASSAHFKTTGRQASQTGWRFRRTRTKTNTKNERVDSITAMNLVYMCTCQIYQRKTGRDKGRDKYLEIRHRVSGNRGLFF
jgi:hypothetical protein